MKIKLEINDTENRKVIVIEIKRFFFENISKTDKPLTRQIKKKKREKRL